MAYFNMKPSTLCYRVDPFCPRGTKLAIKTVSLDLKTTSLVSCGSTWQSKARGLIDPHFSLKNSIWLI